MTVNYSEIRQEIARQSFNVHSRLKGKSVEELKMITKDDRLPFSVICLNITGDMNVGVIIRTSHILGANEVVVLGRKRIDNRPLVGSDQYFPVTKVDCMESDLEIDEKRYFDFIQERNFCPIYCELGGIAHHVMDWKNYVSEILNSGYLPCIVMGNEGFGIPETILRSERNPKLSQIVSIQQSGVIRSLNVSSAFSIIASSMRFAVWL